MPEGDTVWLAGRRMHEALAGRVLTRSDFRVPQHATVDLSGRCVREVVSRGKHLLTRIEGGLTLHTHFRMDGTWHLYRHGERWHGGAGHQVRVVLENADWVAVGYRLPVVELIDTSAEAEAVGHLGPDLLGPDWDLDEAVRRLQRQPEREVGDALLDQRNLAGIGNLYKAETLFLAATSPFTPVVEVRNLEGLVRRAQVLLDRNKGTPQQSTTGDLRRGRQHWVFERAEKPCLRCGTPILLAEQGEAPYARLTYWCPRCQPGRVPRTMRRSDVPRTIGRTRYKP
ncbi:endonuclease-8 [Motilibacter peucedani]|uniref:DNA-(apurinic or apyrimidinic site) lyase n=1 Tax=Motilibacter peucedani TaxID=598650 RepID=A0A420XR94_9ACTN|nr:DNA-formamidopyrimidine glycosylase family protein [Motilibacter peucedani]RKS77426.1 endonuclease-8 [Motilibacter peucedani]